MNKFEKIIEMIQDKIIEAENETDIEYTEEFLNGYINGLEHAKTVINEIKDIDGTNNLLI